MTKIALEFESETQGRPAPPAMTTSQPKKRRAKWQIFLIVGSLLLLALLLTGCTVPTQDPPCIGTNQNQPGCTNPAQKMTDDDNGGDWYDKWAFDIVRRTASSIAINGAGIGVHIFWKIFTTLSGTDFVNCSGAGDASTPRCLTVSVFDDIRTIALVFLPLLFSWKIFKSYMIGGLVDQVYESGFSFVPKILISGFALLFLDVLFTGAFGLSNILFFTILGSPQSLNDLSFAILGDKTVTNNGGTQVTTASGIYTIEGVQDVGLCLFMMIVCVMVGAVWIFLGLCFFLRTILIFIMFCLSPLAVIAGATDEFKSWFGKWMGSVQSLLIAPIPVAVCLALVKTFLSNGKIVPAHEDPAGFLLILIYVLAFTAIAGVLMFKIAGQTGGALFGLAVGAGAAIGGYAAGIGSNVARGSFNRAGDAAGFASGKLGEHTDAVREGILPLPKWMGGDGKEPGSAMRGNRSGEIAAAEMVGATAGQQQSQTELIGALRAMNANTAAAQMANVASLAPAGAGAGAGFRPRPAQLNNFNHGVHQNLQSMGQWAGQAAGIDTPYVTFAPQAPRVSYPNNAPTNPTQPTNKADKKADPQTAAEGPLSEIEAGSKFLWPATGAGDPGPTSAPTPGGSGGGSGAGEYSVVWPVAPTINPSPQPGPAPRNLAYYDEARPGGETPATIRPARSLTTPAPDAGQKLANRGAARIGGSGSGAGKNPVTDPYGESKSSIPSIAELKTNKEPK
jgi:hypothetical protein